MPVTLRDIALKAKVAVSTVSRALRSDASIPAKTRLKLQSLAKEMGYRPDPLITALIQRRWKQQTREAGTIAWISSQLHRADDNNWFQLTLFEGARERAESLGYGLEKFWIRESGMTGHRLSQILMNRGIRGVCIAPLPKGGGHLNLKWEHFSCATIGYSMFRPNLHRAAPHQFQEIMEAVRQLRKQGYRRIGIWMTRDENIKVNYHWMAGALLFSRLHPEIKCSVLVEEIPTPAPDEFTDWIKKEKLQIIIGSNDIVKSRIKSTGLKIPSTTMLWTVFSGIPGIEQRLPDVGASAIDLIVGQIRRNETGIPSKPRVVMVEGEWRD